MVVPVMLAMLMPPMPSMDMRCWVVTSALATCAPAARMRPKAKAVQVRDSWLMSILPGVVVFSGGVTARRALAIGFLQEALADANR